MCLRACVRTSTRLAAVLSPNLLATLSVSLSFKSKMYVLGGWITPIHSFFLLYIICFRYNATNQYVRSIHNPKKTKTQVYMDSVVQAHEDDFIQLRVGEVMLKGNAAIIVILIGHGSAAHRTAPQRTQAGGGQRLRRRRRRKSKRPVQW